MASTMESESSLTYLSPTLQAIPSHVGFLSLQAHEAAAPIRPLPPHWYPHHSSQPLLLRHQ